MTTSLKTLTAGDKVLMATRRMTPIKTIFLGFSNLTEKYGESGPVYANAKTMLAAEGFASFANMDAVIESRNLEYGFGIYAWFQETDAAGKVHQFTAYRYEGGWVIGSGAERISLDAE